MVLQCSSGSTALPEYEEIILCGGYGAWVLSAHALAIHVWHFLVASVSVSPIEWNNPLSLQIHPKFQPFQPCYYLATFTQGKIKPVRRYFIPHGSTYHLRAGAKFAPFPCPSWIFLKEGRWRGFGYYWKFHSRPAGIYALIGNNTFAKIVIRYRSGIL